jgi:hypothetical protein
MQVGRLISLLLLVLLLSACSGLREPVDPRVIRLPDQIEWRLLQPTDYDGSLHLVQKMTASFKKRSAIMLMKLDIVPERVSLVALSPTLMSLFSLVDNGWSLEMTASSLLPKQVDARHVLADIQFVYWPASALRKSFAGTDLVLEEKRLGAYGTRRIKNTEGDLLIRIRYWQQGEVDHIEFEQLRWDYRYHLVTVKKE